MLRADPTRILSISFIFIVAARCLLCTQLWVNSKMILTCHSVNFLPKTPKTARLSKSRGTQRRDLNSIMRLCRHDMSVCVSAAVDPHVRYSHFHKLFSQFDGRNLEWWRGAFIFWKLEGNEVIFTSWLFMLICLHDSSNWCWIN